MTSSPAGISCGTSCNAPYASGTSVTLTAAANAGSTFAGWSGEGCSGTGTCGVSMTQARNVTATFEILCQADGYEPDNTCATSVAIQAPQDHSLCDEDWVSFIPIVGATYVLETSALFGGADTTLALHESCGAELAFDDNGAGGLASRIEWTATSANPLQVRIRNADGSYGVHKGYRLSMTCLSQGCPLFADDFESGTTDAWSSVTP